MISIKKLNIYKFEIQHVFLFQIKYSFYNPINQYKLGTYLSE